MGRWFGLAVYFPPKSRVIYPVLPWLDLTGHFLPLTTTLFPTPATSNLPSATIELSMQTLFSELRSDITGKVVRFLQEDGADVASGEPFVEVEAMKMIMPLKATESGKINHEMSPGSIIAAGDLLASLQLAVSRISEISHFVRWIRKHTYISMILYMYVYIAWIVRSWRSGLLVLSGVFVFERVCRFIRWSYYYVHMCKATGPREWYGTFAAASLSRSPRGLTLSFSPLFTFFTCASLRASRRG